MFDRQAVSQPVVLWLAANMLFDSLLLPILCCSRRQVWCGEAGGGQRGQLPVTANSAADCHVCHLAQHIHICDTQHKEPGDLSLSAAAVSYSGCVVLQHIVWPDHECGVYAQILFRVLSFVGCPATVSSTCGVASICVCVFVERC
jgi:hypothetical protein